MLVMLFKADFYNQGFTALALVKQIKQMDSYTSNTPKSTKLQYNNIRDINLMHSKKGKSKNVNGFLHTNHALETNNPNII